MIGQSFLLFAARAANQEETNYSCGLSAFRVQDSSVGLVAGARYEPVQKILEPAERFVVGDLGRAA